MSSTAATMTVPVDAARELAKWAFAAHYYDGMVSLETLVDLPGVGSLVAEIAQLNAEREQSGMQKSFDEL